MVSFRKTTLVLDVNCVCELHVKLLNSLNNAQKITLQDAQCGVYTRTRILHNKD